MPPREDECRCFDLFSETGNLGKRNKGMRRVNTDPGGGTEGGVFMSRKRRRSQLARLTSFRVLPSPRNIDPTDQNRCSLDLKMTTSLRTETRYLTLASRTSQAKLAHLRPATKRDNRSCALRVCAGLLFLSQTIQNGELSTCLQIRHSTLRLTTLSKFQREETQGVRRRRRKRRRKNQQNNACV